MDWIDEMLAYEDIRVRERCIDVLAQTIYPTPFGAHTAPDERGYNYPVDPECASALKWAARGYDAIKLRM